MLLALTHSVTGIMLIVQSATPGGSPLGPAGGGISMTPIFSLVSLVLNVVLSGAIVGRLLFYRQKIRRNLGAAAGSQYLSIVAMLLESAMLYTVVWICSVVPEMLRVPFENVFTPGSVNVQVRFRSMAITSG
jgi:hypothetical protein